MRSQTAIGEPFGRWVIIDGPFREGKWKHFHWLCRCQCGTERRVSGSSLKAGDSTSCGCFQAEAARDRRLKHGAASGMRGQVGTASAEYRTWLGMKNRCANPNSSHYAKYGGRGITVCAEWAASFEAFFRDMGPRPEGQSIERIDNELGYEPSNCRWATAIDQARNKRTTPLYTWRDQMLPIGTIAKMTGKQRNTLVSRMKRGMTLEEAIAA